ncbi:MAG: hypothetical protein ACRDJY_03210 [Thermoleophilaceae bacterium]
MDGLRVTKLERVVNGDRRPYWRARVTLNGGPTLPVDCRTGSWRTTDGVWEIVPAVAAELQRRVRRVENARGPRQKERTR